MEKEAKETKVETIEEVKAKAELTVKERVQKELEEITERATRLQKFVASEEFKKLPYAQRRLLGEQFNIMASYVDCLNARISIM